MSSIHRTRFAFGIALATAALITAHSASAYTYKVIHDFCSKRLCADGRLPQSGVVMDAAGNLYGTTAIGETGSGNVYELIPDPERANWKSKTLYQFKSKDPNGMNPSGVPILDTSGNLYGTTYWSGPYGGGPATAYELIPNGTKPVRTIKLLATLPNGNTVAGVTYQGAATGVPYDGTSPLYGTTTGTVYQLTSSGGTWTLNTLYSFCQLENCHDGSAPIGTVTLDANGHVFGTASAGGQFNQGVAYELVETGGTWALSDLHDFCQRPKCHDGAGPSNALVSDGLGNFYGTTLHGGANKKAGLVFKLASDGTYTPLYSFCALHGCADGVLPQSDLLMAGGTLYGVTTNGGGNNNDGNFAGGGTVFALNGSTLETLYRFCALKDCRDGKYPMGGLVMDAQGNLFGTASEGGKNGEGVVFELSP